MLQDPGKFLESLFKYDKDNIPDPVIVKIQPYIDNEDFTPAAIAKVKNVVKFFLFSSKYKDASEKKSYSQCHCICFRYPKLVNPSVSG